MGIGREYSPESWGFYANRAQGGGGLSVEAAYDEWLAAKEKEWQDNQKALREAGKISSGEQEWPRMNVADDLTAQTQSLARTNEDIYAQAQREEKARQAREAAKQSDGGYGENIPGPTVAFDLPPRKYEQGEAKELGSIAKGAAIAAANLVTKNPIISYGVPLTLGGIGVLNTANQVQPYGPGAQWLAGTTTGLMAGADAVGSHMVNQAIKNPLGRAGAELGLKTLSNNIEEAGKMAAEGKKPDWKISLDDLRQASIEKQAEVLTNWVLKSRWR